MNLFRLENLIRNRYYWFAFSLIMIVPGLLVMLFGPLVTTGQPRLGLNIGIDFAGGALWDVRFDEATDADITPTTVGAVFAANGFEEAQVQVSPAADGTPGAIIRTRDLSGTALAAERDAILDALDAEFGAVTLDRLETVGPTLSQEATLGALVAVTIASVVIMLYMTFAFRDAPHPFRYGVCAIISMVHDVLFVFGAAAILGLFIGLEVDALFLTAILTTLSFSVHDTIVVFDRVRENLGLRRDETFEEIVNHSVVQTLPRSINTQLTTIFTLLALLLFGGESIQGFVLVLLLGLISGTYSSIFNAAQVLVVWEYREWEWWFNKDKRPTADSASVASSRG